MITNKDLPKEVHEMVAKIACIMCESLRKPETPEAHVLLLEVAKLGYAFGGDAQKGEHLKKLDELEKRFSKLVIESYERGCEDGRAYERTISRAS